MGVMARGGGVAFLGDKNVLKLIVVLVVQICEHTLMVAPFSKYSLPLNCALYIGDLYGV